MFGLVLEGGGTKGAYHIGAYKAIVELGIDVGCIVGSSIGAVNGALFAQGDWEQAERIWDNICANDVVSLPKSADTENLLDIRNLQTLIKEIQTKKGLDISPFENMLRAVIDESKLRSGSTGFGLATFNLTGIKEQQLFLKDIPNGKLVDYLVASCCLPGFRPKKIGKSVYLDGGVKNNLPVDMLLKAGFKDIICVEVKGVGMYKHITGAGCNIISIKSGGGDVGTLDFSSRSIAQAKMLGYFDALRTFGVVVGEKYYLSATDYIKSKIKYGEKIIYQLQLAAEIFGIDKYKVYTVDELAKLVVDEYRSMKLYGGIMSVITKSDKEKATALARAIISSDSAVPGSGIVAGVLGGVFEAASAIAYFSTKY